MRQGRSVRHHCVTLVGVLASVRITLGDCCNTPRARRTIWAVSDARGDVEDYGAMHYMLRLKGITDKQNICLTMLLCYNSKEQ